MKSYSENKSFLSQHLPLTELCSNTQKVLIAPSLQGRVLTSTSGSGDVSYGWINHELIASGKQLPHCNNWGGEDRFWLGPEGGQFSLFFKQNTDFSFQDWQTPACIDTLPWKEVAHTPTSATYTHQASLLNTSGTPIECRLTRTVRLIEDPPLGKGLNCVHFVSENTVTNVGSNTWNEQTGMPSIWILGQFIPSEHTTILIPYTPQAGAQINDRYFGKIDEDRLQTADNCLFFKADGKKRGKIGIPPEMTHPVAGSYDPTSQTLTIIRFTPPREGDRYVNSMWQYQKDPFCGDAVNAYNDGPLEDGSIMGPFYELESSSCALHLSPGESHTHTHETIHFGGTPEQLNAISQQYLGLYLPKITKSDKKTL